MKLTRWNMLKRIPLLLTVLIAMTALLSAGCIENQHGNQIPDQNIVKIGDILANPDTYNGTTVLISGKVVNQCGSGCWFFLDDGTGTLYVDLLPNNFAIPPMAGSKVTVEGTIHLQGRLPYMVGRNVITDLKVYP